MEYDSEILDKTGIFVFNEAVSRPYCGKIIEYFNSNTHLHRKGETGGGYNPHIKKSTDWDIEDSKINEVLGSVFNIALRVVIKNRPCLNKVPMNFTGFQFQHSKKGEGYFKWHSDNNERDFSYWRVLAPILYLNDVEEGGATDFAYQNISVKPEAGKLIIFPASWEYYHKGNIPLSDDKYIITCFGLSAR